MCSKPLTPPEACEQRHDALGLLAVRCSASRSLRHSLPGKCVRLSQGGGHRAATASSSTLSSEGLTAAAAMMLKLWLSMFCLGLNIA